MAGARVDGADDRGRAARLLRSRTLRLPRPRSRPRARDRAVVLPTVVVALALLRSSRPASNGAGPRSSAHAFFNVAVVVRVVGGFWARLDPRAPKPRPRSAPRRGGASARSRCLSSRPRSPPQPRSSSCSRSRCSGSCSSSAARATRPSRRRSTTRRSHLRPARRGRALARAARLRCARDLAATRLEAKLAVPRHLRSEADVLRAPRGREKWVVAGGRGGLAIFLELRWPCSSSARSRSETGTCSTRTALSPSRRPRSSPSRGRRS